MGLQRRDGRDECADAGRNADGDIEDVVHHERGAGEESDPRTEVLAGDGIGAAAGRVGFDRLPIREIDHREEDDNGCGDWEGIAGCGGSEREKDRERGFGAVCSRTKRVKAENRDAGCGADFLIDVLVGGEWATEEDVGEGHRSRVLAIGGPGLVLST